MAKISSFRRLNLRRNCGGCIVNWKSCFAGAAAALALVFGAAQANALPLLIGAGWQHDFVLYTDPDGAGPVPGFFAPKSAKSSWTFTATSTGVLSLQDYFGTTVDIYTVSGGLSGTSGLGLLPTVFPTVVGTTPSSILYNSKYDTDWQNTALSRMQIAFGPGTYTIDISIVLPASLAEKAGFGIRADYVPPVPVPAALPLFATGLGALGFLSWRRKRKAATAAA